MKRLIYIYLTAILTLSCTHRFEGIQPDTPEGNFEFLWQTIDQKYCYIEEKNIDWQAIHDHYLPMVRQLQQDDDVALFDLMAAMLDTLKDGHVNLYSDFDVSRSDSWYRGYPENFDEQILQTYYWTDCRKAGGLNYTTLNEGKVGYIYYGSFSSGFSNNNMYYILNSFKDCKGLILDVRNNGGGELSNAFKLASSFIQGDTLVGYWQHKNGPGHRDLSEPAEQWVRKDDMRCKWLRPVVVLTNRHCYSATNFFVNCMQKAPKCQVVGGVTGGGGGMPLSYELPNGWLVRFSSIKMMDTRYQSIENGIKPDWIVRQKSEDKDDLIEHAILLINGKE